MSQPTIKSNQVSGDENRQGGSSEMMKHYLASHPSTTTDRLVQGNVMSNEEMKAFLKQKEKQLDALVKQAKGDTR
ncbi:uncharacterized protein F4822DRAFT_404998 [Hypoxylon trugodes]|uniref:uncharacterized protein n=1 Tax=Hypoxylon trugodes TaxID=326681 RepID=UPI0021988439|nr:uncharacterized protein F4822DRAFT_404998 [Hypoxylon trugodes]KAI1389111.1 hypothetical protein F4822DRAFT_404998 [Hypoxylon trugodes]